MQPQHNVLLLTVVALIALVVGLGGGYYMGNKIGLQVGIQQGIEKEKAAGEVLRAAAEKEAASTVNPFGDAESTNPFEKSPTNPYEGVNTNPFE